jgi:hypothetical protein
MEDVHFVSVYRQDLAAARFADSGIPATQSMTEGDRLFYSRGADAMLAREMQKKVGFDGPWARFLFRADTGVRLFGPWQSGHGLDLGRVGAFMAMFLELVIAFLVARIIIGRVYSLAGSKDLDDEGQQEHAGT